MQYWHLSCINVYFFRFSEFKMIKLIATIISPPKKFEEFLSVHDSLVPAISLNHSGVRKLSINCSPWTLLSVYLFAPWEHFCLPPPPGSLGAFQDNWRGQIGSRKFWNVWKINTSAGWIVLKGAYFPSWPKLYKASDNVLSIKHMTINSNYICCCTLWLVRLALIL